MEPTCYSASLALGASRRQSARAQEFLLRAQNANGSWPVFPGDDQDGSWVTSLAAIALRDFVPAIPARLKGFDWLLRTAPARNPTGSGNGSSAPLIAMFASTPTSLAGRGCPTRSAGLCPLLSRSSPSSQLPCTCGGLEQFRSRIDCGIQMLLDRACPGGGWNAGNGVVYGEPVAPHADDTAVALLALSDRRTRPIVQAGVDYLERVARNSHGAMESRLDDSRARRTPSTQLPCKRSLAALPGSLKHRGHEHSCGGLPRA